MTSPLSLMRKINLFYSPIVTGDPLIATTGFKATLVQIVTNNFMTTGYNMF